MTEQEIRDNAPSGAQYYAVQSDGTIGYYQFKQNEGYRQWLWGWGWLCVNVSGLELKPL